MTIKDYEIMRIGKELFDTIQISLKLLYCNCLNYNFFQISPTIPEKIEGEIWDNIDSTVFDVGNINL